MKDAIIKFFIQEIKDLKNENEINDRLQKGLDPSWDALFYFGLFTQLADYDLNKKINIEYIDQSKLHELQKNIARFILNTPQAEMFIYCTQLIDSLVKSDDIIIPEFLEMLLSYRTTHGKKHNNVEVGILDSLISIHKKISDLRQWSEHTVLYDERFLTTKEENSKQLLTLLLKNNEYKKDIHLQKESHFPLSAAVCAFRPQCVKVLLEQKANPNQIHKDEFNFDGPILSKMIFKRAEFVKSLAEKNQTHIEIAFLKSLRLLLEYGANINEIDISGTNALVRSVTIRYQRLFIFLICAGADPNLEYRVLTPISNSYTEPKTVKLTQFQINPEMNIETGLDFFCKRFIYKLNNKETELKLEQWKAEALDEKQFQFERPAIINHLRYSIFQGQQSDVVGIINDYSFDELNAPIAKLQTASQQNNFQMNNGIKPFNS